MRTSRKRSQEKVKPRASTSLGFPSLFTWFCDFSIQFRSLVFNEAFGRTSDAHNVTTSNNCTTQRRRFCVETNVHKLVPFYFKRSELNVVLEISKLGCLMTGFLTIIKDMGQETSPFLSPWKSSLDARKIWGKKRRRFSAHRNRAQMLERYGARPPPPSNVSHCFKSRLSSMSFLIGSLPWSL